MTAKIPSRLPGSSSPRRLFPHLAGFILRLINNQTNQQSIDVVISAWCRDLQQYNSKCVCAVLPWREPPPSTGATAPALLDTKYLIHTAPDIKPITY